ncbi:limonene-1,2-epoxide hydrolase [Mycobacterium neumannii]|uniref:limonene-1,2-epoxide hydrolase n=1 Tax=Mycobacterium neumannii TaxID=2048551 RepID=UPI000B93F8A8|nr:limonene-1,2-epoxide hydrolase [Mycobacterium neumannii]
MSDPFDPAAIARAFSEHRFDDTFVHLAQEVSWTIVGYAVLQGAAAVKQMCRDTQRSLQEITTTSDRCVTVAQNGVVVVDTIRRYTSLDSVTMVAACNIYEFVGSKVAAITSYAVEVDAETDGAPAHPS